ncbi:helix-turn-helix transcriptional regulator [Achromobacter piechaudii]|uniref:helix-turn-helix transcriptional regulator n=1 Tax=Achromobacter piechaudii TaxID=72556 RepID=UPI000A03D3CB
MGNHTVSPDKLIDLREVCGIVGLKKSTVYALIAAQRFPRIIKCGRKTLFSASQVHSWVQERIKESELAI